MKYDEVKQADFSSPHGKLRGGVNQPRAVFTRQCTHRASVKGYYHTIKNV